jgi:hypothetical protein
MDELTKCPNCKTRTLERKGKELVCTSCGGHFAIGEEPKTKRDFLLSRHQFYENNKDVIICDYKAIGGKATAKKHGVTWGALYQVLRKWKVIQTRLDQGKIPKASHKNNQVRHRYYEANKTDIIADIINIGPAAARKKWGIPTASYGFLTLRWQPEINKQAALLGHVGSSPSSNGLPRLPEFSNDWEPEVQIKWLDVFAKVATGEIKR